MLLGSSSAAMEVMVPLVAAQSRICVLEVRDGSGVLLTFGPLKTARLEFCGDRVLSHFLPCRSGTNLGSQLSPLAEKRSRPQMTRLGSRQSAQTPRYLF